MSDPGQLPGLPLRRAGLHRIATHPGLGETRAALRSQLLQMVDRLALLAGAICVLLVAGTVGYVVTEGTSIGFGFIWALDTVATVGSIPEPASAAGHIVKVALIVLGVGTLFYSLVTVTELLVSGHLSGLLEERRMLKKIDSLRDHILICGFGRVGRQAARDLHAARRDFVVIDSDPRTREDADAVGVPFVEGSPSDDEVLRTAGIMRAAGVMACVDSDAENIFIALTAREMRSDITIVARASVEDSESKLMRAGADRIVSPYRASGSEMVRFALHPQVTGVVEVAPGYRMEEIEVTVGSEAEGRALGQVRGSAVMVALRAAGGDVQPQPSPDTVLREGDVLIAMGETGALARLEIALGPAAEAS